MDVRGVDAKMSVKNESGCQQRYCKGVKALQGILTRSEIVVVRGHGSGGGHDGGDDDVPLVCTKNVAIIPAVAFASPDPNAFV